MSDDFFFQKNKTHLKIRNWCQNKKKNNLHNTTDTVLKNTLFRTCQLFSIQFGCTIISLCQRLWVGLYKNGCGHKCGRSFKQNMGNGRQAKVWLFFTAKDSNSATCNKYSKVFLGAILSQLNTFEVKIVFCFFFRFKHCFCT